MKNLAIALLLLRVVPLLAQVEGTKTEVPDTKEPRIFLNGGWATDWDGLKPPSDATAAEMQAGTETAVRQMSPARIVEAIQEQALSGDISSTQTDVKPDFYGITAGGGAYTISLDPAAKVGSIWFFDSDATTGTNAVTVDGGTNETFDGATVDPTPGGYLLNKADAWFWIRKTGFGSYAIGHEPDATIPPLFSPNGSYDASTNTPDLSQAANQQDASRNFAYFVSATGTQDIGDGPTEYTSGGQLIWWGDRWQYIAPAVVDAKLDENDLISDSATQAATQRSIKAYVDSNKMLSGAIAPIDGGTTAWFAGQQYTDTTTGKVYRATSASTSPLVASLGSAWVPSDWSSQIFTASFTTTGRNQVRHRANTASDTTLTIDTELYSEGDLKEVTNTNTGTVTVALTGANQFSDIGGNTPTLELKQGETLRLVRNAGPFWTVLNHYKPGGSGVRQFSSIAEAEAATTEPGELIVVGFGSNHLGTWYHHGAASNVFTTSLESVYTEIEVEGFDAASDWMTSENYVGINRKVFRITTPATMGAGQYFSSNGVVLQPNTEYLGAYVADRTAGDSVSAIADDQATIDEFALIRIFEPVVAFDTDDVTAWTSGETGLLRGELRKFTGLSGTQIFSRVADGNDAGGAAPGADWQDITSQLSEAITLISAAGAGGGFNAILGHPTPTRYEVIGSGLPLNIGYPPDASDDKGRSEVFNNSTVMVTIAGVQIPPGSGAIVAAHGQATPLVTPLGKSNLISMLDTPANYTDGAVGDTIVLNAARDGFEFSDPPQVGNAVEREVFTRNRDSTFTFGDLQFSVPSAAFSSLRMRRGSSPSMAISHFATHWSNQQGAASEAAPNFTLTTSWRAFRTSGLNLTQHNNYQFGTFVCNGWYYRVGVYVGSGWTSNRFICTRWRLDGVKGDAGADGVDGTSVDHISQTAGDSSPGTSNTYTLWGDAAETVNLGTYDVPIPTPADAAKPLEDLVAQGNGSWTADENLSLLNSKTWNDLVADGYEKVFISAKENSWRGKNVGGYINLADLIRDGGAELWSVASGSNRYEITVSNVATSGAGTTFTVVNGGTGGHTDFKMWGVRAQKQLVVVNPADAVVDTTLAGTPINAGSTRHYVLQWDGVEIVNTLAKEEWVVGNNEYIVDHLTGHMTIIGEANITSAGTVSWAQAFDGEAYTFAHDLREAQAETASLRINSRTATSINYTLHDSSGTGDGGSQVNYTITGRIP